MAKLIQAYRRYGPKVKRAKLVAHDYLSAYIAESTGLDKHESRMMLGKLHDAILHYARLGYSVKLEGIVTLWPTVDTKGHLSLGRRFDSSLETELNDKRLFLAEIENAENILWAEQDYRDAWNAEFPGDPIEP
jgi:hypothetical protein